MKSLRYFSRPLITCLISAGFIFTLAVPILTPAFASAADVTARSIDLSSSAAAATDVTYTVTFTPVSDAAGFLIDFCDNTPIPGETCDAPTGFSTASVTTDTVGASVESLASDTGVIVTDALTGGDAVTVDLNDITNPTSPTDDTSDNGLYGRIVTYDTDGLNALTTSSDNTTLETGNTDQGGVAMSITNAIGVSAAVQETLTFCVSGSTIGVDCAGTTSPNLVLGVTVGNTSALSASALSTGTVYTQLTTNAVGGAVVNLKSSTTGCGGLVSSEAPSGCYIAPAHSGDGATNGASAGFAFFGVKTAGSSTSTSGATDAIGTIVPLSPYSSTTYEMHYVSGDATGVTSTYGDPILDTDDAPANNQNMPLTFGASINNNTPAGDYSADLNLIAAGTY